MRYAILADIHGNLAAFQAVLDDARDHGGFDEIWCLGDVVGYGPEPHQCIELLRSFKHLCIAGNHDWAAIGNMDTSDFNPVAAQACHWTASQLTEEDIAYLKALPLTLVQGNCTLAHGSPREPIWEYLLSLEQARENLDHFTTAYCLVGHSHVPLVFEQTGHGMAYRVLNDGVKIELGESRLIINPGGVGQPRDGDPRAAYAIYDSETHTIFHYRAEYDIAVTQRKMAEHGLPLSLILRLSHGW